MIRLYLLVLISNIFAAKYEFKGLYKNSELLFDYCSYVGCTVIAPNEFMTGNVNISVMDSSLDAVYNSLRLIYDANGWILNKKGKKILVAPDTVQMYSFLDHSNNVRIVPRSEKGLWLKKDSIEFELKNQYIDSLKNENEKRKLLRQNDRIQIVYALVSDSKLRNLGISWNQPIAHGDLINDIKPTLSFQWVAQLQEIRDSLYDHRFIEIDLDTTAFISWGQVVTKTVVNETEKQTITSTSDYQYGFTLRINEYLDSVIALEWNYNAPPPSDFSNGMVRGRVSVCASGGVSVSDIRLTGIPGLMSIPIIGKLFSWETRERNNSQLLICARYLSRDEFKNTIPSWNKNDKKILHTSEEKELLLMNKQQQSNIGESNGEDQIILE